MYRDSGHDFAWRGVFVGFLKATIGQFTAVYLSTLMVSQQGDVTLTSTLLRSLCNFTNGTVLYLISKETYNIMTDVRSYMFSFFCRYLPRYEISVGWSTGVLSGTCLADVNGKRCYVRLSLIRTPIVGGFGL